MFVLEPKFSFFFLYSFCPFSQGLEVLLLSFLVNLELFLESKMAQPQFLALLSDLPAFTVWDLLGHTLHCVTPENIKRGKKPVG